MPDAASINHLLDLVYATPTRRAGWQTFIDALQRVAHVPVMMFGHDTSKAESLGLIGSGIDPFELGRYHDYFADKNPWMHMNLTMPVGTVGVSDEALPRRELFKTEFYNDWLRHQENAVAGPFLLCQRERGRLAGLALACPAQGVDRSLPYARRVLETLAPHITRALSLTHGLLCERGANYMHLEDNRHAVFVLRTSGTIAFMNRAARRFVEVDRALSVNARGKLCAHDPALKDHLARGVQSLARGTPASAPAPVAVRTQVFGTCVAHTHVFPAAVDHDMPMATWADADAGAFILAGQFDTQSPQGFSSVLRALGATTAESRLGQAVCEGHSLQDYAARHELSVHTVRNQMRALLHKTQARTQADFIRQMHSLVSPFTHRT